MATPVERSETPAGDPGASQLVNLTASARPLYPWPLMLARDTDSRRSSAAPNAAADEEPLSTPDQIDEDFIAFRQALRTDFTPFANELGYLGKQLYIGFNFGESLVASLVFNGTDMLRGEGVLKNLGEIAWDAVLSVVYIAVDQLYLHVPGLPPIVILPNRAPADAPFGWRRPLPPQPGRDLIVPVPYMSSADSQALTVDDDAPAETDDIVDSDDDTAAPPAEPGGDDEEATDEDEDAVGDAEELEETAEETAEDSAEVDADEADSAEAEAEADADADEPDTDEAKAATTPDSDSGEQGSTDTSGE